MKKKRKKTKKWSPERLLAAMRAFIMLNIPLAKTERNTWPVVSYVTRNYTSFSTFDNSLFLNGVYSHVRISTMWVVDYVATWATFKSKLEKQNKKNEKPFLFLGLGIKHFRKEVSELEE